MSISTEPLVEVRDLQIVFPSRAGLTSAVNGISFEIGQEKLGIVGESGSGKSVTCRALLGLIAPPARVSASTMRLFGDDYAHARPSAFSAVRGCKMGLIMQDPRYSLNPVATIGTQIEEGLYLQRGLRGAAARAEGLRLLDAVALREPQRVWTSYAHQLSGGMGQRAMIAMMLAMEPALLIADEPTSALDVTVQVEILALLERLVKDRGMALLLVSHDLRMVEGFCDRVIVMHQGHIVDQCRASELSHSVHPYTRGLLNCVPALAAT
jgi:peptide/nickel transport system ATP-binding protein